MTDSLQNAVDLAQKVIYEPKGGFGYEAEGELAQAVLDLHAENAALRKELDEAVELFNEAAQFIGPHIGTGADIRLWLARRAKK